MIKRYTVAKFRKHIREALNQADEGIIVTIDRYGSTYEITNLDLKPKKVVEGSSKVEQRPVKATVGGSTPPPPATPGEIAVGDVLEGDVRRRVTGVESLDVIKTPTQAVEKVKALPKKEAWRGPISKQFTARKVGQGVRDPSMEPPEDKPKNKYEEDL